MIKNLLLAVLLAACGLAHAAPILLADPYPASGVQPDSATLSVNGGSTITCTLPTVTGGVQPTCDLVSITSPGTYTLVLTVTKNPITVTTADGATTTPGGSASSSPFVWRRLAGGVSAPASLKIAP